MEGRKWTFTAQRGFFSHDDDPESWDFRATTRPCLGIKKKLYPELALLDRTRDSTPWQPLEHYVRQTQWQRLEQYVRDMNNSGPSHRKYKIFYLIRHGQGVHNVKEKEVGREEWNHHWAKLSTDGSVVWEDAELTPYGEQQAKEIATFFNTGEVPIPDAIFSSPLRRCLRTTELAFERALQMLDRKPVIKEKLRERLGVHTCDKRSTRSWITAAYPAFEIESAFTEKDELWKSDARESLDEHIIRVTRLLEDIFENVEGSVVSLTAHSLTLMALFGATGWRNIPVAAGAVYPLLIVGDNDAKSVRD